MDIKTGKFNVISSGSFITLSGDKSEIKFNKAKEKITLEIFFKEKEAKKVDFKGGGEKDNVTISFELPLIENTLGEGFTKLIKFANFDNGDQLYLYIWVRKLSEPFLEVVYSIYVKEINK